MDEYQVSIRKLLDGLSARGRREKIIRGMLLFLTVFSFLLLCTLLGHVLFGLDAVSRFALLMITLTTVLTVLIYMILLPMVRRPTADALAKKLDRSVEELERSLLPVLGIEELSGNPRRPFSERLKKLAEERAWNILQSKSRDELYLATDSGKGRGSLVLFLLLCISLGIWYVSLNSSGDTGEVAWTQIMHPISSMTEETVWSYGVSPGDTSILRGEIPVIRLSVEEQMFLPVLRKPVPHIHYRVGSGKWNSFPLVPTDDAKYIALLGALDSECTYNVQLDRKRSQDFRIGVIDLPSVTWLEYTVRYPDYSGLEDEDILDQGEGISVLMGTVVELTGSSNNILDSAWIEEEGGLITHLESDGRFFSTSFEAADIRRFRVKLVDSLGNAGGDSLSRNVHVIPDRAPSVRILSPGHDVMAPKGLKVPLVVRAEDDYGLKQTNLVYWRGDGEERNRQRFAVARFPGTERMFQDRYLWDLSKVDASVGDVIFYYVEAIDNDLVSGPKRGRSKTYSVKFPTMTEYLRDQLEGGEKIRTGVEDILSEAKRLSELSGELEKRLRGAEEIDWEKKKEIESVAKRGEDLLEEIRDVCSMIENSLGQGKENIFSEEVLEKMMEVRDLLEKYATPEMKAAIERLQKTFESLPPSMVEEAMKKFRLRQDQLVNNLDRTLTALRRLELEQRLEAIEKGLGDLIEKQEELNKSVDGSGKEEMAQLAGEEERIRSELESLQEEMKETASKMESYGEQQASQEMEEITEISEQELSETLDEAIEAMKHALKNAARESGESAGKKLRNLKKRVAGLTASLRSRWKEGTERVIARALSDLVVLSRKQENIVIRTKEHGSRFGPGVRKEILAQQELVTGLQVISEYLDRAAENSFFIGPDVVIYLGMSVAKGHEVAVELNRGEKNPGEVASLAEESFSFINRTASRLLNDLEALQCSASGVGLEEAFLEMERLAQMQTALNQSAQELFMPVPGSGVIKLTEREKALLAKLAADQRAVSEGLESLGDELANRRNILGELRELAREAEEISRDMDSQRLSPEILQRQKRILSRLLDAQKSLQEREFSRRRRAETGGLIHGSPPEELNRELLREPDGATLIELMESWKGTYPGHYESLVFEYLQEVILGVEGEGMIQ
jgi:hypothetical protein